MSEGARIALRLLGLAMLVAGVAALVALVEPGPREIADWMGKNCAHMRNEPVEQCTVLDVVEILAVGPLFAGIGAILVLALRPPGRKPLTIDLSGLRRRRG